MEELDGVPCNVLGYPIKTRTQIYLSCLVTAILELIVYIVIVTTDICVAVQHFRDENVLYGSLTLTFVCLPAVGTFCSIIVSPWQWPADKCATENIKFFLKQLFNLVVFPIGSIYRLSRRIFWSADAIFHERDTYERHHAVQKAAETSPFELYHFLQAYLQAAPQIILQFYILLRGDVFRNYETSYVQAISIIFSFIVMAVVASAYQRFESQKVVGRNYPWTSEHQCKIRQKQFRQTKSILEEPKPIEPIYVEIPGSEQIINRFISSNGPLSTSMEDDDTEELNTTIRYREHKSLHLGDFNLNKENNFTLNDQHKNIDFDEIDGDLNARRQSSKILNIPVDVNRPHRPSLLDLNAINEYENESNNGIDINNQANLDFSPDHPPPPPPDLKHFIFNQFNRLSTFKDMIVMNAELYIKEHVPRLPEHLFEHEKNCSQDLSDETKPDEVDFMMPSRKKIIEGIEQEDIVAKSVAFTAWTFFLVMRMVSLSAFSVFYPLECLYLCLAHYLVMVAGLFYETRFHEKIERTYFYLFLAYIYIFCILEFKIKFKRPRYWFTLYTTLVLLQNLAITFVWYFFAEFESWWFGYMFAIIILSCCYSLLCFMVFYFLLKPADKIMYENDD